MQFINYIFLFQKEQEYEEEVDNDTSVNNLENSIVSPTKDKQMNGGQEKDGVY